jgi:hypothetical protein
MSHREHRRTEIDPLNCVPTTKFGQVSAGAAGYVKKASSGWAGLLDDAV